MGNLFVWKLAVIKFWIVLWMGESDDEVLKSRENVSGTPCDEQYYEATPFSIKHVQS